MQGKIINFNPEKSFGFIMGENGKNYFFHTTDVNKPLEVSKNKMVSFKASKNQKGLCAKNVLLEKAQQNKNTHKSVQKKTHSPSKQKKSKFFRITDLTVNLNDVKNIQVQENGYSEYGSTKYKLVIKTYTSGIIVNYYNDSYKRAQKDFNLLLSALS